MISRIEFLVLKSKVDKIIMENEYFSDVFIALLIKIFKRKIMIYGPTYPSYYTIGYQYTMMFIPMVAVSGAIGIYILIKSQMHKPSFIFTGFEQ